MVQQVEFVAKPHPHTAESAHLDTGDLPGVLTSLTAKQRDVLDLLIEHKTSKEISRTLGISPHTVDQRIMLARAKLGVASRSEVAQAYRRLRTDTGLPEAICERSIYDFSPVAAPDMAMHSLSQDDMEAWQPPLATRREALPRMALHGGEAMAEPYHHVLPEMFDGPYGTYVRLGTIAFLAMFLILIVMGGLAMFAQLSQIIAH